MVQHFSHHFETVNYDWLDHLRKMVHALVLLALVTARPHPWRLVDPNRPIPQTLDDAKALHTHGRSQVRKVMLQHGHAVPLNSPPALPSCASTTESSGLITPQSFGADSSGKTDSTSAFAKAIAALVNTSAHAAHPMADQIVDLGGATLDLQGIVCSCYFLPSSNGVI